MLLSQKPKCHQNVGSPTLRDPSVSCCRNRCCFEFGSGHCLHITSSRTVITVDKLLLFLSFLKMIYFYVFECLTSKSVCVPHAHCACRSLKRAESSGTGVTDGAPPCGCWEPNRGPKQEQRMFLITESSLHPPGNFLKSRLIQTTGGIL